MSDLTRIRAIDRGLLDATSAAALSSPRLRKNHNFHPADDFPAHRLLNAIEPGSFVAPHRHLAESKGETMLVLRGRLGLLIFDDAGAVVERLEMSVGGACCGVDIPYGCWHSVLALQQGTVFFEAKAGPYVPLAEGERAPWAPRENEVGSAAYLVRMRAEFAVAD